MDLLSLIGVVTKKRGGYFSQAESLAKKAKTIENLESLMGKESKTLVEALRSKQIRWEEYSRTLIDDTLVSALAGVYLGAKVSKPKQKLEKAWPTVVGSMLPPLVVFLEETKRRIDAGTLLLGQSNFDFADYPDYPEDVDLDDLDALYGDIEEPETPSEGPRKVGKSWLGVFSRVLRYMANPAYSFHSLGEYYVKEEQGFKEMRRIARRDKKACKDCIEFDEMGWQPIGSLPMPGQECRCYDRCRCRMDYR